MKRTKWTCLACFILIFGLFSFSQAADIHQAAEAGDLAKVKALVEKDPACVKAKDGNGRTPLHLAAQGRHLEVLRYLVDKGADLDALDNNGIAPLHILARSGQTEAARFLIEKGADIDIKDPVKLTPLNMAAESGLEAMVKMLIEKGANIENKHAYGRTPLVGAARERGDINVIRTLLDAGADVNSSDRWGETALDLAAWRGFEEVVNLLLERGAALPVAPAKVGNLLQNAAEKGLTGLFSKVVEKGADLTFSIEDGGTLLHVAAAGGAIPIIETLLAKGLDINRQDGNGWSPLHFAAEMGRGEAVSFLLVKKADINARTLMGQTPYNIAEENGNPDVARALAEKGADRQPPRFPEFKGPYLGQEKPGREPEVFAPGIVSGRYGLHSNVAFSPDGREAFWSIMIPPRGRGYGSGKTLVSREVGGRWTYPIEAVFDGIPLDDVAIFHPDGTKLYDMANRPLSPGGKPGKENIWEWNKSDGTWGHPRPLDEVINNNSLHWQFGVDRKGNIYLTLNIPGSYGESDIYCSRLVDGRYLMPENLGPGVNSSGRDEFPFVDPDGAYLLFVRDFDIYVSFPDDEGKWGEAKKFGSEINTREMELLPVVSPDGRYLFFSRNQDSYWVDAEIIEDLKPEKETAGEEDIILAAKEGDVQKVKVLLDGNPELVRTTDSGMGATALHWAAIYGRKEAVRVLLQHNADVNAVESHSGTTMHWAAHFNDPEVIDWLLDKGARIDHANQMGRTPLHVAARRGSLDVVRRLIERGADIQAAVNDGSTALLIAARNGHREVVDFLIAAGVSKTAKNNKGESYLDILFTRPKTVSIDPKIYEAYAGKYSAGPRFTLDIRKEGDHLYYYAFGKDELLPLSETEFITSAEVKYFTFVMGEDGRAGTVVYRAGSGELKTTRAPEVKEN
ncbi:MAG: ankyrin repeat domain-containing protein [Candidatus Aminicenantes bacterium]|nr:ankyrin repeat domain-containing protein [Candidatus Aminicenantes bacterium]